MKTGKRTGNSGRKEARQKNCSEIMYLPIDKYTLGRLHEIRIRLKIKLSLDETLNKLMDFYERRDGKRGL